MEEDNSEELLEKDSQPNKENNPAETSSTAQQSSDKQSILDPVDENKQRYIDNPQAPSGLHRRRKKEVAPEMSPEIAEKLSKNPKLMKFFGVGETTLPGKASSESAKNNEKTRGHQSPAPSETVEVKAAKEKDSENDAREELLRLLRSEENKVELEDESSLLSIVSFLLGLIAVAVVLVMLNIASNGDFGRMVVAMFPRETEALKIKEYLEKFHHVVKR